MFVFENSKASVFRKRLLSNLGVGVHSLEEVLGLGLRLGLAGGLAEQLEGALLRLVALAGQELQSLLSLEHLLPGNNPTVLVLHQVLLLQTARRVLRRAVEYHRL